MLRYDQYLYKTVRVKLKNGRVFEGMVSSFEGEVSSQSGQPEISIDWQFGIRQVVALGDIETIDVIAE